MKNLFDKLMVLIGGKRGLSVIASGVVTYLASTGKISPATVGLVGGISGAMGVTGIVHSNLKASDAPPAA